jgi:hypothetical protein
MSAARNKYIKVFCILLLFLICISTVNAEETSIILDQDQTTDISGTALVFCSLIIVVFAAVIIIKILTSGSG